MNTIINQLKIGVAFIPWSSLFWNLFNPFSHLPLQKLPRIAEVAVVSLWADAAASVLKQPLTACLRRNRISPTAAKGAGWHTD